MANILHIFALPMMMMILQTRTDIIEDLNTMLEDLSSVSQRACFKLNKTKIMLNDHVVPAPASIGNTSLEVVVR